MSSKAREALDKIGNISAFVAENCGNAETAKYMNDIISIVQETITEPLRNCDVGTAEEQTKRLREVCNFYKPTCLACPYRTNMFKENCWLKWSQMPYEEVKE